MDKEILKRRIEDLQRELNDLTYKLVDPLQRVAAMQGKLQILSEWLASLTPEENKPVE